MRRKTLDAVERERESKLLSNIAKAYLSCANFYFLNTNNKMNNKIEKL